MTATATTNDADQLLAVYLRDHFAGAAAGLALAERCQRANDDNPLGPVLKAIAAEIAADRDSLRAIMTALDVSEDPLKTAAGRAAEIVGRLKSNGVFTHYSPSSRVIELEGLLAGIDAKRNLWHSLRLAATTRPALDTTALDQLIARANSQRDRLQAEHERAVGIAFTPR